MLKPGEPPVFAISPHFAKLSSAKRCLVDTDKHIAEFERMTFFLSTCALHALLQKQVGSSLLSRPQHAIYRCPSDVVASLPNWFRMQMHIFPASPECQAS
mmetsp:Transcript_35266/g.62980  ORF Transcript_35266/g.62980 Transcript_35266/m.62980 type:complete len:100 (-) Transcript_35266:1298-1597(-)